MAKKQKRKSSTEKMFDKILGDKVLRKEIVQKRLEYFFPIYFHKYIEYETAPFQKEIFNILEDEKIKLAVIVAFRGSAKSTIITTAYVLWSILGVQQRKFIVICGQTEQKARQYLMNIKKELLENDLLKKDLGPFEEEKNSLGNATALIIKRMNVKILISSVEQSIRGMRHGEYRPDLIILDDIEDTSSVKTKEGRDKAFDWLTSEVIPAGDKRTRIIAVGNLLHEDSVLKRLKEKIESKETKYLKGVYREYPIINAQGKPLWSGKYPTSEDIKAEEEKTMDEITWHREYLLKIISTAEQVVRPEWIHFYDEPLRTSLRSIAIGVDLAVSEKTSADCTAMVAGHIYGHGKNMKIYIQPNPINERIPFPEQKQCIQSLVATQEQIHPRVKLYVEDVGYQRAFIQALEVNKYDVEGVPSRSDKVTRLRLTTSLLKEGRILFPKKGCEELIEQLIGFGKERHDDLADAFAILTLKVIENNPKGGIAGLYGKHRFDAL